MIEIQGKINTAVCYAKSIDELTVRQISRMCDYGLAKGSRIRIMPDVHIGRGCTIGTTMTVTDKVCPNIVGVDIACGMYTVKLCGGEPNLEKIDAAAHFIPSGTHIWDKCREDFDLTALKCFSSLRHEERLARSLGTLGGGNHFIEIDRTSDGTYYLVIHSGSRNLGKQVAEIYQCLAVDVQAGRADFAERKAEIITSYKAQGRSSEIQSAIKALADEYGSKTTDIPEELCWLSGKYLADYLHDSDICRKFARRSREIIAEIILETAGINAVESFHTDHNYIDTGEMILRKSAVAAHEGERIIIPINMRDGSIMAVGKGNPEWNYSAPHGAGRIMSRKAARERLSLEEYKASMEGIFTTSVCEQTLDEAPMAYKSMEDIIEAIRDSVEIIDIMKPVYNFKAPKESFRKKGGKDAAENEDQGE